MKQVQFTEPLIKLLKPEQGNPRPLQDRPKWQPLKMGNGKFVGICGQEFNECIRFILSKQV
jgi:hypothetical protein